ncbi:SDR family oxidoreductase [Zobellia galactanivorans]|uniref:Short-chain dehydrogenase/reductase n=1 Tax=Zobellia galactanivorans (strain DSM 12802 / CCUG 47099 / CIP 106680 / NCIMB 13871 / Dsij) TaxID=63186 RepID=G0L0H4_ZOBGA|nr:SDR family oxidoreductase [Zobellia galactanivorans]CAZ97404.1 Short-chain dehydrogenase/reductase [Zobellia galactanivorans]
MSSKKLVVITGASSGIGKATAELFSKNGHPLLLIARRIELIEGFNLPNTLCKKVDVTDIDTLKNAIAAAEEKFGPVDCMINNAGMMLLGDIATQDPLEWKKMFDVNVLGLLNGMQAVLPQMKTRQSGTIINTSSIAGRKTFANHAAYCGTKFGVHAITENAREEAALYNVRMVTIAPGAVETELLSHTTSKEIKEGYENWKKEMGEILNPVDIANAMWYAYNQPQGVNIREIVIAATKQQP